MELFDGSLYWPTTYARATPVRPLHENIECEALIVGAGITGAMVAWELAQSGIDTVVVDRRTIAAGSTAASTAMLMYDLDAPLVDLRTRVGREHADGAYRASRRTIEDIARLVQQLDDPSDFVSRQSLMLASRAADVEELRHEAEARAELGIEAEFLDRHELARSFGMQRPGALLCGGSAEVNPVRLTHALLRAAAAKGTKIFDRTELELPTCIRQPHIAHTSDGHRVRCRFMVIAAGYETPEQFADVRSLTTLKSTYAIASQPLAAIPWPGGEGGGTLIWETARPYCYMRTTPDRRVIVGGEDIDVSDPEERDARIGAVAARLARKGAAMVPGLEVTPQFAWAGTFAETDDSLPLIGELDCWPGVYFALGYGGNGITFSALAAQIIRDAVTGRDNADAPLFSIAKAMRRDAPAA